MVEKWWGLQCSYGRGFANGAAELDLASPGKAQAEPGTHACSIELAVEHADLFQVQKLAKSVQAKHDLS